MVGYKWRAFCDMAEKLVALVVTRIASLSATIIELSRALQV
jgi:hypothetical protein